MDNYEFALFDSCDLCDRVAIVASVHISSNVQLARTLSCYLTYLVEVQSAQMSRKSVHISEAFRFH